MTRLDKYIFGQIFSATLLSILVFIVFWIAPEIMFKTIKLTIAGQITTIEALKFIMYQIPEILGKAIPVGLMIGSLFVFDRLSKDSEIHALRAVGVSILRLTIPVIMISIIGILACIYTNERLVTTSSQALKNYKGDIYQEHFVYVDKEQNGKPKNILIIGNYTPNSISNIKFLNFSEKISNDRPIIEEIITADFAKYKNNYWSLINGIEYKIAPDGVYKNIRKFNTANVLDNKSAKDAYKLLVNSTKKSREMNISELAKYADLLGQLKIEDEYRYTMSKLHQRFAQPFSCLFLALCGIILGINRPREKRTVGFTVGVALVFIYFVIVPFLDMLTQNNVISPALAAWGPNIFIFLSTIGLIKLKQI